MCLFEDYQQQPKELYEICKKYEYIHVNYGLNYSDCELWLNEVEKIGFTFDYGLDAEPFNLRKK